MNRISVAKELMVIAKSLLGGGEESAQLIDSYRHPVDEMVRRANEIKRLFEECSRELGGLRRFGVGDTEADMLLHEKVFLKLVILKRTVDELYDSVKKAIG